MPPTLLLPGALGAAFQFEPLLPLLHSKSVHTPDYPAHGNRRNESLSTPNIRTLASDLLSFVDRNKLSGCRVFGHSMGGYLAAFCELERPGTFSKIITLGTKWTWNPALAEKEARKLDYTFLAEKAPALIQRLELYHGANRVAEILELTRQILLDLGNNPAVLSLETITCPIEINLGEHDRMVSQDESEAMADTSALARFILLAGAPHGFEEQEMQRVVRMIEVDDNFAGGG